VTIEISKVSRSLVESVEANPLHVTLGLEGCKGPWKFEWMINLHGVSHGMQWMAFHGLPDFASSSTRRREGVTICIQAYLLSIQQKHALSSVKLLLIHFK
jgi:hypothetical protein